VEELLKSPCNSLIHDSEGYGKLPFNGGKLEEACSPINYAEAIGDLALSNELIYRYVRGYYLHHHLKD